MKLISVRITHFRSIEDSGEFTLADLTCLVGKNESGKTTILRALERLNPISTKTAGTFDVDSDYPRRHVSDYADKHEGDPATVVAAKWLLTDEEVSEISTLVGSKSFNFREITTTMKYDNQQYWDIQVDESLTAQHVLTGAQLDETELSKLKAIGKIETISELKAAVLAVKETTPKIATLRALLEGKFKRGRAELAVIDALSMPKFFYFGNYDRMDGRVAIDALAQRKKENTLTKGDEIAIAFLGMARTSIEDIKAAKTTDKLIANLEAASNRITGTIFKYWSQNRHLSIKVDMKQAMSGDPAPYNTGQVLHTRVWNDNHKATVSFDDRSTGFVWFFSFLAYFSEIEKTVGKNVILLLDEPGLTLHARAQSDLLRYFRDVLLPKQVIYTTHSPFLVPGDDLLSVRTVEDVVKIDEHGAYQVLGTKVSSKSLSTDRDTLFPLQGALGYDLTQCLFIGNHSLIVEGPGDLLYLTAFSEALRQRRKTTLDPHWTITPARGLDRISTFVTLFGAHNIKMAVFTDYDKTQKKKIAQLESTYSDVLASGRILTANRYTQREESDIEDLLGNELYVDLVNATYGLTGARAVPAPPPSFIGRIVKHVEDHLRTDSSAPAFDHYAPAVHLTKNPVILSESAAVGQALQRFEAAFIDLNALILQ